MRVPNEPGWHVEPLEEPPVGPNMPPVAPDEPPGMVVGVGVTTEPVEPPGVDVEQALAPAGDVRSGAHIKHEVMPTIEEDNVTL